MTEHEFGPDGIAFENGVMFIDERYKLGRFPKDQHKYGKDGIASENGVMFYDPIRYCHTFTNVLSMNQSTLDGRIIKEDFEGRKFEAHTRWYCE